jgi:hypothetical protein
VLWLAYCFNVCLFFREKKEGKGGDIFGDNNFFVDVFYLCIQVFAFFCKNLSCMRLAGAKQNGGAKENFK